MIPAGETSAAITVPVIGDELQEAPEGFQLELSNPVNAVFAEEAEDLACVIGEAVRLLVVVEVAALVVLRRVEVFGEVGRAGAEAVVGVRVVSH